jgi:hypothetical protein
MTNTCCVVCAALAGPALSSETTMFPGLLCRRSSARTIDRRWRGRRKAKVDEGRRAECHRPCFSSVWYSSTSAPSKPQKLGYEGRTPLETDVRMRAFSLALGLSLVTASSRHI